ncbi:MAG: PaaI family thioesterase [Solirubrobacteraceae bacterium]
MDEVDAVLTSSQAFDALLGVELDEVGPELVRAHVIVRPELLQPVGIVHGGVLAAVAETLASRGTMAGVLREGGYAVGLANHTSFLRPISEGRIDAVARPLHSGRTTWVWDVELADDHGRRCAVSRVTIAVRWAADA